MADNSFFRLRLKKCLEQARSMIALKDWAEISAQYDDLSNTGSSCLERLGEAELRQMWDKQVTKYWHPQVPCWHEYNAKLAGAIALLECYFERHEGMPSPSRQDSASESNCSLARGPGASNQVINIENVHGIVGTTSNSRVTISDFSSDYPKLDNQSVKLEITATLSLETTDTRHGLLTIKALNSGTKVARVRRVTVSLMREAQTFGGVTSTPDSSELNIGQKQAVVQIQGDDDMHEWQQVLKVKPNFEVHERAGERYGKGYIELTSGKKVEFEFLLLPDSVWNQLTAPIALVFGDKTGHKCSRCGFVFLSPLAKKCRAKCATFSVQS